MRRRRPRARRDVPHRRGAVGRKDSPTRVDDLGADLLSIAGHKLYAPKGIGALYIRAGTKLEPLVHGAGHEHGRRAGTESAMLAAALGEACRLAGDRSQMPQIRSLRDRFWSALRQQFGDRVALNGHPELRLPNTLNVSFVGRDGAEVLAPDSKAWRPPPAPRVTRAGSSSPRCSQPCGCRSTSGWARCGSASGAAPRARRSTRWCRAWPQWWRLLSEAAPRTDEACDARPWPHEVVALRTGRSLVLSAGNPFRNLDQL